MCTRLSPLIDLSTSWTQRIDSGRLRGRSVEVVEVIGPRNIREAEANWKLYRECDNAQRNAQQSLLRRYYASFTCGSSHYVLRDVTTTQPSVLPYVAIMVAQLIELGRGLPESFIHGNPTLASISFLGRLPVALNHKLGDLKYFSRSLIQVDYGGVDSMALSTALASSRQRSIIVGDELLGAIVVDDTRGLLTIRAEASFPSFLREYSRHARAISLYLLIRGLFSLYPSSETSEYSDVIPQGGSSAKSLREAFEELKGHTVPIDAESLLRDRLGKQLS